MRNKSEGELGVSHGFSDLDFWAGGKAINRSKE